jgi:hypothetical protein
MNHSNAHTNATAAAASTLGRAGTMLEAGAIHGQYRAVLRGARAECYADYVPLFEKLQTLKREQEQSFWAKLPGASHIFVPHRVAEIDRLQDLCTSMEEVKADDTYHNLVTDVGARYLLDNGLAGSAYTAAFYLGLISSTSYTAVAAADTMASHAGWLEAGSANTPVYSESARRTAAWSAAATRSKALSAGLVFTFTGSGTVKGSFLTTVATKDGTTGTLYSAGLFSGGDQPVVNTNTLTVSYTASL